MELEPGLMCNVKIQRDDMPSVPALPPTFTHCSWAARPAQQSSRPGLLWQNTAPLGVDWLSRISAALSADSSE